MTTHVRQMLIMAYACWASVLMTILLDASMSTYAEFERGAKKAKERRQKMNSGG